MTATYNARSLMPLFSAWLTLALAFALSGVFPRLPPPAAPGLIFGTTLLVGATVWRTPSLRRAALRLDLRWLVAVHVVRAFVGLWFLSLGREGLLHPRFVAIAGPGDIVAGAAALVALIALTKAPPPLARRVTLTFNVIAAIDICAVIVTAQSILFFGPGIASMRGFFRFPGPLIPSLLVPLVLLTHAMIAHRLRATAASTPQ